MKKNKSRDPLEDALRDSKAATVRSPSARITYGTPRKTRGAANLAPSSARRAIMPGSHGKRQKAESGRPRRLADRSDSANQVRGHWHL